MKLIKRENIGRRRVYDIEVADVHNFFANGINVHNCATDGGVSIIDGPAGVGTVKDLTCSSSNNYSAFVAFTKEGHLWYGFDSNHTSNRYPRVQHELPSIDVVVTTESYIKGSSDENYMYNAYYGDLSLLNTSGVYKTVKDYIGTVVGLHLIKRNPSNPSAGAVAYITNNYNTGLMRGDIQACLMADTEAGSVGGTITDRSVKGNDATITGTLTKSAVASGAELMAHGGFSASNYATIPYSSDFDFGTGNARLSIWVNTNSSTLDEELISRYGREFTISYKGSTEAGSIRYYAQNNANSVIYIGSSTSLQDNSWHKIDCIHNGGTGYIYIDGELDYSGSFPADVDSGSGGLFLGIRDTGLSSPAVNSNLCLGTFSLTAPTPEQIKADYLAELPMFQENAKCTLSGSSNNVLAMSYDDSKDEATVITNVVDTFNGLVNVKQASLTGTGQCVDSRHGVVAIGTSSQVTLEKPEINLREELAKQAEAPRSPYSQVWFDGDASETDFELPSGYNVWAVYNEGMLVKEGLADQYTIEDNGINKVVSFNVAPASGNDICVMIYKEIN